jgi:hypothetical protein
VALFFLLGLGKVLFIFLPEDGKKNGEIAVVVNIHLLVEN